MGCYTGGGRDLPLTSTCQPLRLHAPKARVEYTKEILVVAGVLFMPEFHSSTVPVE